MALTLKPGTLVVASAVDRALTALRDNGELARLEARWLPHPASP